MHIKNRNKPILSFIFKHQDSIPSCFALFPPFLYLLITITRNEENTTMPTSNIIMVQSRFS